MDKIIFVVESSYEGIIFEELSYPEDDLWDPSIFKDVITSEILAEEISVSLGYIFYELFRFFKGEVKDGSTFYGFGVVTPLNTFEGDFL